MERPLIVVLDGFDEASTESATSRFVKGAGFAIVPRAGGRLECRLTGAVADLVREVAETTGASPKVILAAAIATGLPAAAKKRARTR